MYDVPHFGDLETVYHKIDHRFVGLGIPAPCFLSPKINKGTFKISKNRDRAYIPG